MFAFGAKATAQTSAALGPDLVQTPLTDPGVFPASDSEYSARAWGQFLAQADFDAVMASYAVLSELAGASTVDAASCKRIGPQLTAARRINPFSPALQRLQRNCARADGSARVGVDVEGRRLIDFLLAEGRGESAQFPILVATEADAAAMIESLDFQPLYGRYIVGSPSGGLPFVAIFYDPERKLERQLYFDFLRVWQSLHRDAEGSNYPAYLSGLAEHYLEGAQTAGNTAAELAAITLKLGRKELEPEAAIGELERLALAGSAPAAFELLPLCLISRDPDLCTRTAVDLVRPLAERGLVEGMVVMALAAQRGLGPPAQRKSEGFWLERASRRAGSGVALTAYAQLSASLDGEKQVSAGVRDALRKAARAGHPPALLLLAQWLRTDRLPALRGENRDRYLQRAVALGHAPAIAQLGLELLRARKYEPAWKLLEQAAARDEPSALGLLALAHDNGNVGRSSDPAKALALYRRAAMTGNSGAMRRLGRAYLRAELGLPANIESAEAWYLSAALFGNSRAAVDLAELYLANTQGLEGRAKDGYAVLERLAADGMVAARLRLAMALLLGQGVDANPAAALKLLSELEAEDNPEASFRLGQAHQFGQGAIAINHATARAHYQTGARHGDGPSMDQFARALYAGRGGPRERVEALKWWQRAALKGSESAANNLAWVRCSSRDERIRDPHKGTRDLGELLKRKPDANLEDTLAACLAASGQYEQAVATQRSAIAKAKLDPSLDAAERAVFAARLARYERGEAWFEE